MEKKKILEIEMIVNTMKSKEKLLNMEKDEYEERVKPDAEGIHMK